MKFYGGQGAVRWAIYYNSPMKIDKFLFGSAQLFHFHFHFRCLVMATGHAFALNPHATELLVVRWCGGCGGATLWWWQVHSVFHPRIPGFHGLHYRHSVAFCRFAVTVFICVSTDACPHCVVSFLSLLVNTHSVVVTNIWCIESIAAQFFLIRKVLQYC